MAVRANAAENVKGQLDDGELVSQMTFVYLIFDMFSALTNAPSSALFF
jgi:hypothetical protein